MKGKNQGVGTVVVPNKTSIQTIKAIQNQIKVKIRRKNLKAK